MAVNELATVTRAARQRARAEQDFRAAITAAREARHTLTEIGQAAGLTKQGVRWLLMTPDQRTASRKRTDA